MVRPVPVSSTRSIGQSGSTWNPASSAMCAADFATTAIAGTAPPSGHISARSASFCCWSHRCAPASVSRRTRSS